MSSALLRLEGVRKTYGSLVVSDDVSLCVDRTETYALIGPNGAGKSTLLAQIAGELTPDRGSISLGDRAITHMGADARARLGIARSFQVSTLFDEFSIEDNVALALRGHSALRIDLWSRTDRDSTLRARARNYLERAHLETRAALYPGEVSHGERRQLEIAMALAMEPALLLLDEPMAGLGAEETRAMIAVLAALKGTLAMLIVEHDMDAVEQLADRVGVLVGGAIIASGTFGEVRNNAMVREAYLGERA